MLNGYIDADMVGDTSSKKSISRYGTTFARGAMSWQSELQKCIALSATKVEYIAATTAYKEIL